MVKKIVAVAITLAIVLCMMFECSLNASAVLIADDALVIASVVLACAGAGLTIYSWSEFFQGDNWRHFCYEAAGDISTGFSMIVRSGKRYVSLARDKWSHICSWITNKFSGMSGNVNFSYQVPVNPSSITLDNGLSVPYADWMSNPFFVYQTTKYPGVYAWYCDGQNPGVNIGYKMIRMLCAGSGTVYRYELVNGSWSQPVTHSMTYGITYKGVTGSFYDLNFMGSLDDGQEIADIMQYRTMDLVTDNGTNVEQSPPNNVPTVDGVATMQGYVDENKLPGAVDAPASVLAQGEHMIVEIPDSFLETVETVQGQVVQLTTNVQSLVDAVNGLRNTDVRPAVMTNAGSAGATVEQVIEDTVENELESDSLDENVQSDTEVADKFRLPKSFLEGFPFSIPYSVYLGLQSFIADPEAPSFALPFSIPRLGINETVRLDLAQFNPLARVCRAFLSLVWVAGLAMACNAWIKR